MKARRTRVRTHLSPPAFPPPPPCVCRFARRARTTLTEKTKSYAELYECLVGQVPKGVKPFGPLRAACSIVREIGHALKGVTPPLFFCCSNTFTFTF